MQWHSPAFSESEWTLTIDCDDGSSGTWRGGGVWSGSSCGGAIGYGGGSSGYRGGGGSGTAMESGILYGGVDIEQNYGPHN